MFEGLGKRLRAYANKDGRGYPDWAVRYVPVVKRLRRRGVDLSAALEVGANENGFSRFADTPAVIVDRALGHLRAARDSQRVLPVLADATALPFRDNTFGACVCMDTFEHLPESVRRTAAAEIGRVLRPEGTGVVGFPSGEASAQAEEAIRQAYRAETGGDFSWFEEHAQAGLPDARAIRKDFEEAAGATHTVTARGNASLVVWRMVWRILICGWPGRGNAVFQALLRLATPVLTRIHWGRCYRTILWIEPRCRR